MAFERIIINSIPKSGTYLLTQLVSALGQYPKAGELHFNDAHYTTGTDAAGKLISVQEAAPRHIANIPSGHCAPAHLTWSAALEDHMRHYNTGMFFMYRDPRDIVISYIKYAMYSEIYRYETEGHKQYYDFLCTLENDQRRVEHMLRWRLFVFQFYENSPWLFSSRCLPLSFEALYADLMALGKGTTGKEIKKILAYLSIPSLPCKPQELFERVFGKSKTAMGVTPSSHKEFFDDGLHEAATTDPFFKSVMHLYSYA